MPGSGGAGEDSDHGDPGYLRPSYLTCWYLQESLGPEDTLPDSNSQTVAQSGLFLARTKVNHLNTNKKARQDNSSVHTATINKPGVQTVSVLGREEG